MAFCIFCRFFVSLNLSEDNNQKFLDGLFYSRNISFFQNGLLCFVYLKAFLRLLFCFEYLGTLTCSCIFFNDRLGCAAFKLAQVPQGTSTVLKVCSTIALPPNRIAGRKVLTDSIPFGVSADCTGGKSPAKFKPLICCSKKDLMWHQSGIVYFTPCSCSASFFLCVCCGVAKLPWVLLNFSFGLQ